MQHLGVNFGGIWRFELFLFIWFVFAPEIWADFQQSSDNTARHLVTGLTPTGRVPHVAVCNAMQMPLFIRLNPRSRDASKHLT